MAGAVGRRWALIAALAIPPILYLLFVTHYRVNIPLVDDWNVVPLIHVAEHGQLTLHILWAQHNENRMFFPNLIYVEIGVITHDDLRALILLSAVLFIATYGVFLVLTRHYVTRSLTAIPVLVVGVIWFSLADRQNALWGFQFAWYLILACLFASLYLLEVKGSWLAFGGESP